MELSTTQQTIAYIKEHPDIKSCLKKGILNYSSLARTIASELGIEKKTSKEAILIAARRYKEQLKGEITREKKIRDLLSHSEIDIKNKMSVLVIEKNINLDALEKLQKEIRKQGGTFYFLEGSQSYTLITQEKYAVWLQELTNPPIISQISDLSLINFKSPKEIELSVGVIAYLASLFTEHNVNILELVSIWTDTLFVVESKDVPKVMGFVKF